MAGELSNGVLEQLLGLYATGQVKLLACPRVRHPVTDQRLPWVGLDSLLLLGGEQEERIQADPWQTLIRDWMADPRTREKFDMARGIQTEELLEHAIRKLTGHWTEGDQKRVVACLRGLKHARLVRSREDGVRVRRYLPDAPK